MKNSYLLLVLMLLSLPSANATEEQTPTSKQAVLKAIELAAGKGFFRHCVEVAVSQQEGEVVVVFRRPTSDVMETAGRKPTKEIWRATFQGPEVKTEVLDQEASRPTFDQEYSRQRDQKSAQAISKFLSQLWKAKEFDTKEFAVDVSEDEDRDNIFITHIPYTPDAHSMGYVFPDGRVEIAQP